MASRSLRAAVVQRRVPGESVRSAEAKATGDGSQAGSHCTFCRCIEPVLFHRIVWPASPPSQLPAEESASLHAGLWRGAAAEPAVEPGAQARAGATRPQPPPAPGKGGAPAGMERIAAAPKLR